MNTGSLLALFFFFFWKELCGIISRTLPDLTYKTCHMCSSYPKISVKLRGPGLLLFLFSTTLLHIIKTFSPTDQEYLRFLPRNLYLFLVAKVLPSYGIKMLLLDSALNPWVDLWMVDHFPHGSWRQVSQGWRAEQPRAGAPPQQGRQVGASGRVGEGRPSTWEGRNQMWEDSTLLQLKCCSKPLHPFCHLTPQQPYMDRVEIQTSAAQL